MAVEVIPLQSKIRLQFQTGTDGEGDPVYKNKTISRVKSDATDQNVFDVATALGTLCTPTLNNVTRINENNLAEGL